MARDRGNDEPSADTNGWLTTFADLVMLLLTFFVLLLTMSSMDTKKLRESFSQFRGAPGVLELGKEQGINPLAEFVKSYATSEHLMVVDHALMRKMLLPTWETQPLKIREKLKALENRVDIVDDNIGITISFHGDMFFQPGQANLRKDMLPFLDNVAEAIEVSINQVNVIGHTDNTPPGSGNLSNRLLSLERAMAVLNYFLEEKHLSPERFAVAGYGDAKPIVPNDTPENRSRNRRVEIVFKYL